MSPKKRFYQSHIFNSKYYQSYYSNPFQNGRSEIPNLTYGTVDCVLLMKVLLFPSNTLEVSIELAPALTDATIFRLNRCS
jgi:hypothetical protein